MAEHLQRRIFARGEGTVLSLRKGRPCIIRNRLIFAALVVAAASPSFAQKSEQVPAPPRSSPEQGISSAPAERTESTPPTARAGTEPQRQWLSFLPLMADEARKRGVDLPLPFGAS